MVSITRDRCSYNVRIDTNVEQSSMMWGNIEADRKLPPSWFAPPQFERTGLQDFLERLYYERADTSAVQWSYHSFRAGNPRIDTHRAIRVGD